MELWFRRILTLILLCLVGLSPASTCAAGPQYSALIVEYPSLKILHNENSSSFDPPASLTKVMTLYLVFQALDNNKISLNQPLIVSRHAANRQPSKLGLKPNQIITLEEAICGLVTKSANDAATVIAENMATSEDEFAHMMTEQAKALGMKNTRFVNASGVPNTKQITTATDMAILGISILRDFPHYYHYFGLREFNFDGKRFRNHNHLLGKYSGCDGIKTGFTVASGFNLISSAIRDGRRIIGVILGGQTRKSRDQRMMQLLDIGFKKIREQDIQKLESLNIEKAGNVPQLSTLPSPSTTQSSNQVRSNDIYPSGY